MDYYPHAQGVDSVVTQPVINSYFNRLVLSVCGARWVEGDVCPTSQELQSGALTCGTVMCSLSWRRLTHV